MQSAAAVRGTSPSLRHCKSLGPEYIGDDENGLVRVALATLLEAECPYCPVTLVGGTGLGKTLLACGLAGNLRARGESREILLYSGADFSRAVGYAAETNHEREFRRRIAEAGGLIIDDAQQLAGKPRPQEELIMAINRFVRQRLPMLLTFRRPPTETSGLLPGLASRIVGGLIVPLLPPGSAARAVLVERLARRMKLAIGSGVEDELAGSLASAAARRSTITRKSPTVPQLQAALERLQAAGGNAEQQTLEAHLAAQQPDLSDISAAVARYFDQSLADLHGPLRRKELVQARSVAMYLARQLTDKSLGQVGQHFGNRDHTTVLHACRKTEKLIQQDAAVRKAVEELAAQFSGT